MGLTLQQKAEHAAIRRQIAADKVAAKQSARVLNYLNDNLKSSRKRKVGATTPAKAEQDFSNSNRLQAMAMARQKVEECPLAAGLLTAHLDLVVGNGFRLMMKTDNRAWNNTVEEWWHYEKDLIDIRGVRSWGRLLRTIQARQKTDGDVGGILVAGEFESVPWSRVQIIEADRISKEGKSVYTDDGIDFDDVGMPIKYHVWNRAQEAGKSKVVPYDPADFFFHLHDLTERAERRRGMSAFLQLFNLIADYGEIIDGIVQKVKNECFIGLKFKAGAGGAGGMMGDGQSSRTSDDGIARQHVDMVPGMNLHLDPESNEDVEVMESKTPSSNFDAFEKKIVSRIAFPFGLTYELITGDYSNLNYTSGRAMMEMVKRGVRYNQAELGRVASRIFFWALSRAVKGNVLSAPSGMKMWGVHDWGKPGFASLNPMQEAMANGALLDRALTTRQRILAETSDDDFDDTIEQLAVEQSAISDSGVPVVTGNGNFVKESIPADEKDGGNPWLT